MTERAQARATVVVVEDNDDNLILIRALLEERFEVREHREGRAALDAMARALPDVVLLDLALPEMDGLSVLAALRERHGPALPVVAVTAHAMLGDKERLLAAGFDAYISKPIVDGDAFLDLVQSLAERAQP